MRRARNNVGRSISMGVDGCSACVVGIGRKSQAGSAGGTTPVTTVVTEAGLFASAAGACLSGVRCVQQHSTPGAAASQPWFKVVHREWATDPVATPEGIVTTTTRLLDVAASADARSFLRVRANARRDALLDTRPECELGRSPVPHCSPFRPADLRDPDR
jgi:hypothetical protein